MGTSAFKLLNTANTGNLTSAEMEGKWIPMFKDFNLGKNEVKIMIEEADDDKNGTVEADEFIGVLKKNKDSGEGFWGRLKLFDAIGGKKGVQAIVTKMYEKIKQDRLENRGAIVLVLRIRCWRSSRMERTQPKED